MLAKKHKRPPEPTSLEEERGKSLVELLEEHAPRPETDFPPRRPRGRSRHYLEER